MDILTYINKMNRLYGNDPVPVRFNTQKYLQGGRVGMKPGGLVEPGVTHYATEYLSNEEFSSLYKKFKGTDKEFAEFLNKEGYKAKADRKFTADSVYSRRDRLGLEGKGYVRPTMKDFKKEAKAFGIDIKGLDDEAIKRKVRDKRALEVKKVKRLTDPVWAKREAETRKKWLKDWAKENPEKIKEHAFKYRQKIYLEKGIPPPAKNAKEELWRSLFQDAQRHKEGRRLKIIGNYDKYIPRDKMLDAKILDTKTKKTITFKNLENYINPKNTGKTYAQVIKPYNQKWFINDTPGLRTEINSKLIPNWNPGKTDTFFEIQHNAGRYNDPFDVSLSNESLNLKESQVRTKFEKMWNASDNLSDKKKAFRFYKENLPNEILSKPSMVERPRYFGTEVPFEKQLQAVKTKGVNLPKGTLKMAQSVASNKKIAKILSKSFRCGQADGISCDDPRAYMKSINEQKALMQAGDTAAANKFARAGNAMLKLGPRATKFMFGPAMLWGEPLFEGVFIANDMLGHGTPWREAVSKSFWTIPLQKMGLMKSPEEYRAADMIEVKDEKGKVIGIREGVKRYIDAENRLSELNRLRNKVSNLEQQRDTNVELYGTEEYTRMLRNARKELEDYTSSVQLAGGEKRFKKIMEADKKAFREREEVLLTKRMEGKKYTDPATRVFHERTDPRYQAMESMYPTLTTQIIDDMLATQDLTIEDVRKQGLDYGDFQDSYKQDLQMFDIARAGGVANMKTGGKVDYDNYLPNVIDDDK